MKIFLAFFAVVAACGGSGTGGTGGNGATSFNTDVKPILTNGGCLGHHMTPAWDGVNALASNAAIVNYLTTTKVGECNGGPSFVAPGNSAASYIVQKLSATFDASCGTHTGSQMPLGGAPLAASEIATVRAWIDEGALAN
ncbi:MAG TPA: hypothetical protein VHB97_22410 [Polyangia bacterium]|nr:hypothetical protein [Polyangia bacterium]